MEFEFYPDMNTQPQAPAAPAAPQAPATPVAPASPVAPSAPAQTDPFAGQYSQYSNPNDFFFAEQLNQNSQSKADNEPDEPNPVRLGVFAGAGFFGKAIAVTAVTAIFSVSAGAAAFFIALVNFAFAACLAVLGLKAYNNLKGSAIFLGSYFIAGTLNTFLSQAVGAIFGYGGLYTTTNILSVFFVCGMIPALIMLYERIKNEENLPEINLAENLNLNIGEGTKLYNPIFIAAASGAITLLVRLVGGLWTHGILIKYGAAYYDYGIYRATAIMQTVVSLLLLVLVLGAGLFLSGSIKKIFEFCGYFCVANEVTYLFVNMFNLDNSGKIVLIILLSIVFSAIGTAASYFFTLLAEKNAKIKLPF